MGPKDADGWVEAEVKKFRPFVRITNAKDVMTLEIEKDSPIGAVVLEFRMGAPYPRELAEHMGRATEAWLRALPKAEER